MGLLNLWNVLPSGVIHYVSDRFDNYNLMQLTIIIGYHKKDSFNHSGIVHTIKEVCVRHDVICNIIDLYADGFNPSSQPDNKDKIEKYQSILLNSSHHVYVSPVWWFRCTSMLEGFFDQIFTPGFAYNFKQITKTYGIPVPKLGDKKVITYLTHGAPALPVYTIYLNSVWGRLQLGVFSFVYGWFRPKIRQFFSVPFCSQATRVKYLTTVQRDIEKEIKKFTP